MQIIQFPQEMQHITCTWRCAGERIGFVPTMGALHEGHLSLAQAARRECDKFVASIFVNPLQFAPHEDLDRYPRTFEHDCDLLRNLGCDAVFAPSTQSMYAGADLLHEPLTFVEVSKLGEVWEGAVRPGHLRGVATVVAKLFNITKAHRAYFGEKDYQQLKVVQCMVRDLNCDVDIVPMPTVREADGLALSSRNRYLSPPERASAAVLFKALTAAVAQARQGERDVSVLGRTVQQICDTDPLVRVQYITIVDTETLEPLIELGAQPARILIAARVGDTRLIDNVAIAAGSTSH
jgi:pantoate--beta-alanine ligase